MATTASGWEILKNPKRQHLKHTFQQWLHFILQVQLIIALNAFQENSDIGLLTQEKKLPFSSSYLKEARDNEQQEQIIIIIIIIIEALNFTTRNIKVMTPQKIFSLHIPETTCFPALILRPQEGKFKVWPNPFSLENHPQQTPLDLFHPFTGQQGQIKLMHILPKHKQRMLHPTQNLLYLMSLLCVCGTSLNCTRSPNSTGWHLNNRCCCRSINSKTIHKEKWHLSLSFSYTSCSF